jgi:uroporphyrinogen-III synthase
MSEVLRMNTKTENGDSTPSAAAGVALFSRTAHRTSSAAPFDRVLAEVVELVGSAVPCDACYAYVLEGDELVLRASTNPHRELVDRLKLGLASGITAWVSEHREPVAVARRAYLDQRFKCFDEPQHEQFEAFLSVPMLIGGRLVGVINLQNRAPYLYSSREISLVSTLGFLLGAEMERVRLEGENSALLARLESRKIIERAKGVLQRDLKIDEVTAYRTLQREAQHRRKTMREIAEAVLLIENLKRRSD